MRSLAIVGVGLIGGSFALALRKAGFDGPIWGVSSPRSIEAALQAGAITSGATLAFVAAEADVLYLAQPIAQIIETIAMLGTLPLCAGCLVTDAGSTKLRVVEAARQHLPAGCFLGGHPLAGKEVRGVEHADAELFRSRPYVLTPSLDGNQAAQVPAQFNDQQFRAWLKAIGAKVVEMSAADHDRTVAYTSHLPQLLSTALAATLSGSEEPELRRIFGSGLLDMTRLALSTPEVWTSILESNKPAVKEALRAFSIVLADLEAKLDGNNVTEVFEKGALFAYQIRP